MLSNALALRCKLINLPLIWHVHILIVPTDSPDFLCTLCQKLGKYPQTVLWRWAWSKVVFWLRETTPPLVPPPSQVATEKDFLDAVNKVIKAYAKFSSTPRYMAYN